MKNFRNGIFKLVAILLVVGAIFGITNFAMKPAYAETHEQLADIFLTREELADWKVKSPFYYTKSESEQDISVGGEDGPSRTLHAYKWTPDTNKMVPIEDFLNVMEECLKILVEIRTNDAAYARYMISAASCSETRNALYEELNAYQDK